MKIEMNNKGLTLVELIVGMAIMSLIMAGIFGIFSVSIKSYLYSMDESQHVQDSRNVLNQICDELRYATNITSPSFTSGTKTTGNRIDFTTSIHSGTENRSIYIGTGDDANTVLIDHGDGTIQRLATKRGDSIKFTRDDTNKRKITVSLTIKGTQNAQAITVESDVVTLANIP